MSTETITTNPIAGALGAEVSGIDLAAPLSNSKTEAVRQALWDHKVIFFRDQSLSLAAQIEFGKRFGSLEVFPFATPPLKAFPEILPIVSGPKFPTGANNWHSDVTWRKSPSLGSILYCEVAPQFGGETGFADTYATFQGLSEAQREELRGKTCIHDFDVFRYRQVGIVALREPLLCSLPRQSIFHGDCFCCSVRIVGAARGGPRDN